jgi:acyl dehydratase
MTSLYYEDFEVGQRFRSGGRTITETDLTMFSMLSGDWNPIHADAEFAAKTRFKQRLVHGALGIAVATGMMHEMGIFHESVVAMLSLKQWFFRKPILVGDTLRLELDILAKGVDSGKRSGLINRELRILNQRDEVVQEGTSEVLVLKRTAPAQAELPHKS